MKHPEKLYERWIEKGKFWDDLKEGADDFFGFNAGQAPNGPEPSSALASIEGARGGTSGSVSKAGGTGGLELASETGAPPWGSTTAGGSDTAIPRGDSDGLGAIAGGEPTHISSGKATTAHADLTGLSGKAAADSSGILASPEPSASSDGAKKKQTDDSKDDFSNKSNDKDDRSTDQNENSESEQDKPDLDGPFGELYEDFFLEEPDLEGPDVEGPNLDFDINLEEPELEEPNVEGPDLDSDIDLEEPDVESPDVEGVDLDTDIELEEPELEDIDLPDVKWVEEEPPGADGGRALKDPVGDPSDVNVLGTPKAGGDEGLDGGG